MAFDRETARNLPAVQGTPDTVVSAPATDATKTIIGLSVANVTASGVTVDVMLNDGTNDTYLIKNAPISAGGTLVVVGGDQKLVLTNPTAGVTDTIKVDASSATAVDVVASFLS